MGLTSFDIQHITMLNHTYLTPGFPFRIRTIDSKWGVKHIPHWHNEFEFIYQSKGSITFKIGSRNIKLLQGQAILVNIGDFQWVNPSGETDSIFDRIIFSPDLLHSGSTPDLFQVKYLNPLINNELRMPSHIKGVLPWEKEILSHITDILEMSNSKSPGYELHIRASIHLIFAKLFMNKAVKKAATKELFLSEEKAARLSAAINYIHDNLSQKITINDISAHVNMNPYNFMHFFKFITSESPVQYINYCRVKKACELLSTTDMKILDIAMETGFESLSYFNRIFKRYKRCTPMEFKELNSIFKTHQLPEGWHSIDIGPATAAGSSKYNGSAYIISGAGSDIWSREDRFHFSYIEVSGDCSITARVKSIQDTDRWAKAGVMIRDSTNPSSIFADCVVTPSNYVSFQWRAAYKKLAECCTISDIQTPVHLKIARRKYTYTAHYSIDGTNWIQIGDKVSIKTEKTVLLGLAVTSLHMTATCTAVFDSVKIKHSKVNKAQ